MAAAQLAQPVQVAEALLESLRAGADPANVAGMARFGISTAGTLGVKVARIRALARDLRRAHRDPALRHAVAGRLWRSGVHEARILATLVDEPVLVTARQAEAWIGDVDSWDVCDQLCNNLLRRCPDAAGLAAAWTARAPEFTRRAGLVLLAVRAVHDRAATDSDLAACLTACEAAAADPRHLVKKATSWALRQVGKRSPALREAALAAAARIRVQGTPQARWIEGDVRRELERAAPLRRRGAARPTRR
jgi:3-methyladenine DNA glycosylase AlkD